MLKKRTEWLPMLPCCRPATADVSRIKGAVSRTGMQSGSWRSYLLGCRLQILALTKLTFQCMTEVCADWSWLFRS